MSLTVGSLFSGIGGLDLGLERAGMTVRWQVEIDPFCNRVLRRHWPDVARFRDVREVAADELEGVDLIAGGFPCQDISGAGRGAGLAGERSGLWFEFLRIVRELRPAWVLVENVPALRTRGADVVLGGLEEEGYATTAPVVGARHVGAPHRRDRVWIVAHGPRPGRRQPRPDDAGIESVGSEDCAWSGERGGASVRRPRLGGTSEVADSVGHSLRLIEQRMPGGRTDGVRDEGEAVLGGDGEALAHGHGHGREGERRGGLLDGERAALRDDADGCCRALAHSLCARLEKRRPQPGDGGAQRTPAFGGGRWPVRPGERQHEWEEPRTVESPMGGAAHGPAARLVGRHRRAALKALGNCVVPQIAEVIGRAILSLSRTQPPNEGAA